MGWEIEGSDARTGERCELRFAHWIPSLWRYDENHAAVIAQDVAAIPLVKVPISLPSGELLVTDTLRVPGFAEGTELGEEEYSTYSLNSDQGCVARISAYAQRHDMGFKQTTNTVVSVWCNEDGRLLICAANGDEEGVLGLVRLGWENVGRVSCDVWRVTLIDHVNAVRCMGAGGVEKPATVLSDYLANAQDVYSENVVRLKVVPGVWTLHSGHDFSIRFDREAAKVPPDVEVWCILVPGTI